MLRSKLKGILSFLWQLPQNLVGLCLIAWFKPQRVHRMANGVDIYYSHKMKGGISLGKYVLVNTSHYRTNVEDSLSRPTVRHEALGHARQSLFLGWLYLVIIGLPSFVWASIWTIRTRNGKAVMDYHKFYTERNADKLAKIERR